jgi:hypothetical protein
MTSSRPLRLLPGVVLAILLVILWVLPPLIAPNVQIFELPLALLSMFAAVGLGVLIILWWMFLSRAPWLERLAAIVLMAAAVFAARLVVDESIRGAGQRMLMFVLAVPVLSVALVMWAAATRHLSNTARRAWMVVAIALGCVPFAIVRTAGVRGAGFELHWRWTPTPEERLLAQAQDAPKPVTAIAAQAAPPANPVEVAKPASSANRTASAAPNARVAPNAPAAPNASAAPNAPEWPGFRGANRDDVVGGTRINTDWSASPPVELWRKPIGPGWSSFAVDGDLLYTQEQRGEEELVTCYRASTGDLVWRHSDRLRFYESNGGPGPRGTPTIAAGRVYAVGATGIVKALDARTGARIWSRDGLADTARTLPEWGIASSPLVVNDAVIVAVGGQLIAYDAATGNQRWIGQSGGAGYSSPHLVTIGGVAQVLLMRGARTISVSPTDGKLLWDYSGGPPAASMVQPALTPEGDVLVAAGDAMGGTGIRRVAVKREGDQWKVEERWHSRGLKPYFSDYVVHKGHAFGFDGAIMSSINLADGERNWKGGRYGNGQLLLLPDQDVLLIISEEGELALVSATPDKFTELARFPALSGKTWNHPVLIRDVLVVRNGEEMAAFRLSSPRATTDSR